MGCVINIKHGERISIDGRMHEFMCLLPAEGVGADGPDDLQFRDVRSHRPTVLSQAEFDQLYAVGKLVWPRAADCPGDGAPEVPCEAGDHCQGCPRCWDRRRRANLLHLLKQFDDQPVPKTDLSLTAFLAREGPLVPYPSDRLPKAGTFRRHLRERGAPGDRRPRDLADRRKHPKGGWRIHPLAYAALLEKAEPYWTSPRVSAKDVHAALHTTLCALNSERDDRGLAPIPIPSRQTVWRHLTRHSDYDHTRSRFGTRKSGRWFKPLKGRLVAKRPLDIAILDHTVADVFVVDDEHNVPVGRPYISALIDVRSRYPLSIHLSFTPPSVETAMASLRKAVRPKTAQNDRYPHLRPWRAFGVPRTIVVDNAWEFTGSSFADGCADCGISIDWAPVRTPEYKGICERFFRTLNLKLLHKLEGATFLRPHLLKELGIDPAAQAVLLLSELEELIHNFVTEVYGRDFHGGLKDIPEKVWLEQTRLHGVDYAGNLSALDRSLSKLGPPRILSRKGLEFLRLPYCSETVHELLNDLVPRADSYNRARGQAPVKFKYWPEDLSRISVWNEVRRCYVEVKCMDTTYTSGLSEHRHNIIREYAEQRGLAFSSEAQRCEAQHRLNAEIGSLVNERKIGRRKQIHRLQTPPTPVTATDLHLELDELTPVEAVSNRRHGETPLRQSVRKRGKTTARRERINPPVMDVLPQRPLDTLIGDPFSSFDLGAVLDRAREKRR